MRNLEPMGVELQPILRNIEHMKDRRQVGAPRETSNKLTNEGKSKMPHGSGASWVYDPELRLGVSRTTQHKLGH